jgi:hypothetical protein
MPDHKFNLLIWFSLILIALAVASIDVMMFKVNEMNPDNEPAVTNIVYNDVWYKISVILLLGPAILSYYINKSLHKFFLTFLAGMILIFFGLEDVLYFMIRSVFIPNNYYEVMLGPLHLMPSVLPWLSNNVCITIFGNPVTAFVLFKSTAFALAISFVLAMI